MFADVQASQTDPSESSPSPSKANTFFFDCPLLHCFPFVFLPELFRAIFLTLKELFRAEVTDKIKEFNVWKIETIKKDAKKGPTNC